MDRALAGGWAPREGGHISVLLEESMSFLAPAPGKLMLDATLGLGGHTRAMLEAGAQVVGLDRDAEALARARAALAAYGGRLRTAHSEFSRLDEVLDELGIGTIDGAMADLGVSSLQLDSPGRGFSFLAAGPLDMRMNPEPGRPPAAELVSRAPYEELKTIIRDLGEEPMAGRIARRIVEARGKQPIEDTLELAELVKDSYPAKWRAQARNHPATRTFQALRMAVNRELEELENFLDAVLDRLNPGGRLVVISFHSLEDRLVKHRFRDEATACICPPRQPLCTCNHRPRLKVLTKKPVLPGDEETAANPRSRSAKLRAAERLEDGR